MIGSMGEYDNLFNEFFSDDDFGGDNEKKELCRKNFNELLKDVDYSNLLDKEGIKNIMDNMDNSNKEWDRKDFPILSNEVKGINEIDEMIMKYDMTIYDLHITRNKLNYIITEIWESWKLLFLNNKKAIVY